MLTVTKTIISTVLLSVLLAKANTVEARLKYYRYDANIPMVEMSLNMMVAMGVIEQIPGRLVHDGNPYSRLSGTGYSPYSRNYNSSPVSSRYYNKYRYNDYWDDGPYSSYYGSRYGSDPWDRTWNDRRDSPWASQWDDRWDSPWTSRTSRWNNPWYSSRGGPWGNSWNNPWNTSWGSPWGNAWNSQWMNPWSSPFGYTGILPLTPDYSTLPLSPVSPDLLFRDDGSKNSPYQPDDSSLQYRNKEGYSAEKTSWRIQPPRTGYKRTGYKRTGHKRAGYQRAGYQRAGYPGYRNVNQKPHRQLQGPHRQLNGLWIGDDGEMLGIRGNRFLWYDDDNQYTSGQLLKSPSMMKARIEGRRAAVSYHYRLHGNELVIMGRDGKMRTFNRMPLMQPHHASARPHAAYSSYHPQSDNSRIFYSSYGPDAAAPKRFYPRNQSASISSARDINRRTDSVAQRNYYSAERSGIQSPHRTYAGNDFMKDIPAASTAADLDSDLYTTAAFINGSGNGGDKRKSNTPSTSSDIYSAVPTTAIPQFKQYKPAAGKANLSSGADSVVSPAKGIKLDSSTWNSSSAGPDMNDPNTYLYSYLKDTDNIHNSVSSQGNSDNSTVAVKNESANIWKPNNSFPDRRRNTGLVESEFTANSEMRKFSWPETGSWD